MKKRVPKPGVLKDGVFVLRDPSSPTGEEWRVQFEGKIHPATWTQRGPAEAQLDLLKSGYSKMPAGAV